MKFVDIAQIHVNAGNGGPGARSFRREKYAPKGGPDGGDGGDGGGVVFIASQACQTLLDVKLKRAYKAKNGSSGKRKNQFGSKGEDLIILVPLGTKFYDDNHTLLADLTSEKQVYIAASGGSGGKGNAKFSSSTNRTPRYAQPGLPGEEQSLHLELRLIAEAGLVGLPNAGKSTLLKTLTNANPKIAAYPFTTLFPNLGILKRFDREIVIADIPGVVEGASKGVGLGIDFLRHIDRTKLLIHLVSAESNIEEVWKGYCAIQQEFKKSIHHLQDKPQMVLISKIDTVTPKDVTRILSYFKKKKVPAHGISCFTNEGLDTLIQSLLQTPHLGSF
ncbi:MAG: GTPase ObgE [Candidatus Margulisbacteria bacterium]|nr:GTPase ObgE [Candidatus Margulisiibacteriota bacterium]